MRPSHLEESKSGADFLMRDANNLNVLRLLAALAVVISHCALLRTGHESDEPFAGHTYFNLGDDALLVFFFISGLTISASYARSRSVVDFVAARVLRIWPALFAISLLIVFVVAPVFSTVSLHAFFGDPAWLAMIAKTAALSGQTGPLPGLFETNPLPSIVNGPPWTLRYEVVCYALLLVGSLTAARLGAFTRALWIPAATCAAGLIMILTPAKDAATSADHLLRFWFAFGLGALAYQFRAYVLGSVEMAIALTGLTGALFCASIGTDFECTTAILFIGAGTLLFAQLPMGGLRSFCNRFDLSYGVYITAWPITQIIVATRLGLSSMAMLLLVIGSSLSLALASWLLIERPAIRQRGAVVTALEHLRPGWCWNSPFSLIQAKAKQ